MSVLTHPLFIFKFKILTQKQLSTYKNNYVIKMAIGLAARKIDSRICCKF